MTLTNIDLHGLGEFTESQCGFRIYRYHLEECWSYIYVTESILLKLDQLGPDYVQFKPPSGTVLFRRERHQKYPSILVWIRGEDGRAFTNFWAPAQGFDAAGEPDEFCCKYQLERATYRVLHDGILSETELFVAPRDAIVVLSCKITNVGSRERKIEIIPVVRPHFAAATLAPWDVPSLYQTVAYSNEIGPLFHLELRSPAGIPEDRRYAFVLFNIEAPDAVEVDYAKFIGAGSFERPEFRMEVPTDERFRYDLHSARNACQGVQGVVALSKRLYLQPKDSFHFVMVLGSATGPESGQKPSLEAIESFSRYFGSDTQENAKTAYKAALHQLLSVRNVSTPDAAFSRYVNEWLPLQLNWVHVLDRGWPTGMRGTRDSAQDTTAVIPLNPSPARQRILELFSVQRSDGWFPRQYSLFGKQGKHDLRNYVDGGVWVWELLFDYLRWTKDFGILEEAVPFLDREEQQPIIEHALRIADYYLSEQNLGEHGLCLIREGDWNDSINRAGLEGRGESVMVSCQVVLMLKQAAYLLEQLDLCSHLVREFKRRAERLTSSILTNALNEEGYLNGVFTDNGEWVFSPKDPDGRWRISVPVNAWGIISGVLAGDCRDRVVNLLAKIKQRDGWPLFTPPIGDPPIRKLGRIGQGDLLPGLGENGTSYNHGSHGFLARAVACAKRGDLLFEVLRYMLPYDQECHPVQRAKTAPYAVVNHWKTAPGLEGRGGDPFLTGSISTALRNVYDCLFGIKPLLNALAIDPCLPSDWSECSVRFSYLGAQVDMSYYQGGRGRWQIAVNGEPTEHTCIDWFGVTLPAIPDYVFEPGRVVCIDLYRQE